MSDSVKQDDLAKALAALQDIAKGHNSRGTKTTEVVSMQQSGAGAGSSAGATQVYHTSSNSDPQGWAGSTARAVPEDGATDSVSENGTDYSAQSGMMKSILTKLAKGLPLTANEAVFYAEIAKGNFPFKKDDDKDEDDDTAKGMDYDEDDKKDDKKMDKSLSDYAGDNESVSKGLEVSEFLAGFADVVAKSLESMEARIVSRVTRSQAQEARSTGEFQKSLADAVAQLGAAVTVTAQRVDQVESQPAHAPRAVQNVQALEKGNYGGQPEEAQLSKSMVAAVLVDLVHKSEATASDVLKFDSSGVLSPQVEAKVRAALGGGR